MSWTGIALIIQLFFGVIIGLYFWNLLKSQRTQKVSIDRESKKEMEHLRKMRSISLSEPLAEKVRPQSFSDIIGPGGWHQGIKSCSLQSESSACDYIRSAGSRKNGSGKTCATGSQGTNEISFQKFLRLCGTGRNYCQIR